MFGAKKKLPANKPLTEHTIVFQLMKKPTYSAWKAASQKEPKAGDKAYAAEAVSASALKLNRRTPVPVFLGTVLAWAVDEKGKGAFAQMDRWLVQGPKGPLYFGQLAVDDDAPRKSKAPQVGQEFGAKYPKFFNMPNGKRIDMDTIVPVPKKGKRAFRVIVAAPSGNKDKMMQFAQKRAEDVIWNDEREMEVEAVLSSEPMQIVVPGPLGPLPVMFTKGGWAVVNVNVLVYADTV